MGREIPKSAELDPREHCRAHLDTKKAKADPSYLATLLRARDIPKSTAAFYHDFIFTYVPNLISAQEAMAEFNKENPEYQAEDDDDDDEDALAEAMRAYKFPPPAVVRGALGHGREVAAVRARGRRRRRRRRRRNLIERPQIPPQATSPRSSGA